MKLYSPAAMMLFVALSARPAIAQVTVMRADGTGGISMTSSGMARDNTPEPTGSARIRGQVVASETGAGLRNVQVRLTGGGLREGRTAGTDGEGRYDIDSLPAGRYTLTASKTGFVTLSYGQRRPFESGRPVEVADKQTMEQVDFALPRGGVIVVRVTDEFGDPMSGVRVQAERYRFLQGQRSLGSVGSGGSPFGGGTDDRGEMRLYGMPPGEYFVSAGSGSGLSGSIGATDKGRSYATSYYPGTGSVALAQTVDVRVGREVSISFPLTTTRLARVSAIVQSSDGAVLKQPSVSLSYSTATASGSRTMTTQPDGSFSLADVPPGDYTINVSPPILDRSGTGEYASVPVKVEGEDIKGLTITTGKGGRLRGRFVFDTPVTPDVRPASMRPMFVRASGRSNFGGPGLATVNADWTFDLPGIVDAGIVRLSSQAVGWHLKAVMVNGKDVTDTPLDFSGGREVNDVQVVVTRTRSEVAGVVTDSQNAPVAEYVALVFPEEREQWTTQSRFMGSGRPDQQGRFKITGLPPGRYLVAAVDYLETGAERDPDLLGQLKSSATLVSLGEGESKTVSLKVVTY